MLNLRIYFYQNRRNPRTLKPICVCVTRKAKAEYILTYRYTYSEMCCFVFRVCETVNIRGSVLNDP
jgi:hypothetical protein